MPRYEMPQEGEWVQPVREDYYRMMCCDCGLVHKMDFRIFKGRVQFRAFRDDKAIKDTRKQRVALSATDRAT